MKSHGTNLLASLPTRAIKQDLPTIAVCDELFIPASVVASVVGVNIVPDDIMLMAYLTVELIFIAVFVVWTIRVAYIFIIEGIVVETWENLHKELVAKIIIIVQIRVLIPSGLLGTSYTSGRAGGRFSV
jgi:hypothetical protein